MKVMAFHPNRLWPSCSQGDILEEDEDYLDELSQPVVSDGELGGDDLADTPSSMAAPPSKSPALPKKKQHPTYRGSWAFPNSLGHEIALFSASLRDATGSAPPHEGETTRSPQAAGMGLWEGGSYRHARFLR